jgi:hypothetical protein
MHLRCAKWRLVRWCPLFHPRMWPRSSRTSLTRFPTPQVRIGARLLLYLCNIITLYLFRVTHVFPNIIIIIIQLLAAAIDHNLAHGALLQIQHVLEAHLASNNSTLKSGSDTSISFNISSSISRTPPPVELPAIVEAAVASVEAKEGLLLGLRCPPVQSEFLSIVASLVPFSSGLKERSAHWVASLLAKTDGTRIATPPSRVAERY